MRVMPHDVMASKHHRLLTRVWRLVHDDGGDSGDDGNGDDGDDDDGDDDDDEQAPLLCGTHIELSRGITSMTAVAMVEKMVAGSELRTVASWVASLVGRWAASLADNSAASSARTRAALSVESSVTPRVEH